MIILSICKCNIPAKVIEGGLESQPAVDRHDIPARPRLALRDGCRTTLGDLIVVHVVNIPEKNHSIRAITTLILNLSLNLCSKCLKTPILHVTSSS